MYLLKVNNRNTRLRCEICSELTNFTPYSSVSIVNFEHVNADWNRATYITQLVTNCNGGFKTGELKPQDATKLPNCNSQTILKSMFFHRYYLDHEDFT